MTAKNENREAGRPEWASGLDLSVELYRASDDLLKVEIELHTTSHWVLRRLADAEMEVARLRDALVTQEEEWMALTGLTLLEAIERGHGRVEREEPYSLVEYFTEKLATAQVEPDRSESNFLIDSHGDCWFRAESDGYVMQGGGEAATRSMIEWKYGPCIEAWK